MQTKFRICLIAVIAVLIFSSCKKSNTEGRYVPKNAAFVLHVDGESMNAKLPWEEVKQSGMFRSMYADTSLSAYLRSVMDNPDNSGIDIKNDFLVFFQKDSSGDYIAIQGIVKDEAKFRQFNNEVHKTVAESEKQGIHFLSNDKVTASWNKEKFILVMNDHTKRIRSMNMDDSVVDRPAPAPVRDLNAIATSLFSLTEDNSLAEDERFSELMKSKGDIHFWVNGQTIGEGMVMPGPMNMVNMSKLYAGSLLTGTASFDKGQINADIRSYSSKEMAELWKKYRGEKISSEMVKRIPSGNIALLLALNFKPEGLKEFLKVMGLDGFANMATNMYGFTIDDLVKAIKGDMLLAVSDITTDSMGKPGASILFVPSVSDKASFEKLIHAGKKITKEKMGDSAAAPFYHNSNDSYFAIGNKKAAVDNYLHGNANTNFPFLEKISGHSIAAYINFQYIMSAVKGNIQNDSLATQAHTASMKMWDNLISYGGDFKDGAVRQHVEINLVDKSTNSLKQLNSYLGTIEDLRRKKRNERATVIPGVDSIKIK